MAKSRGEGRKRCGARFGPKPGGGGTGKWFVGTMFFSDMGIFVDRTNDETWPKAVGRPAISAFEAAGYRSLDRLAGESMSKLLRLHGVGPKAIRVIRETLESRGLPPLTD